MDTACQSFSRTALMATDCTDKPGELPPVVAEWTRELRAALRVVAKNYGLNAEQFDEKN